MTQPANTENSSKDTPIGGMVRGMVRKERVKRPQPKQQQKPPAQDHFRG